MLIYSFMLLLFFFFLHSVKLFLPSPVTMTLCDCLHPSFCSSVHPCPSVFSCVLCVTIISQKLYWHEICSKENEHIDFVDHIDFPWVLSDFQFSALSPDTLVIKTQCLLVHLFTQEEKKHWFWIHNDLSTGPPSGQILATPVWHYPDLYSVLTGSTTVQLVLLNWDHTVVRILVICIYQQNLSCYYYY